MGFQSTKIQGIGTVRYNKDKKEWHLALDKSVNPSDIKTLCLPRMKYYRDIHAIKLGKKKKGTGACRVVFEVNKSTVLKVNKRFKPGNEHLEKDKVRETFFWFDYQNQAEVIMSKVIEACCMNPLNAWLKKYFFLVKQYNNESDLFLTMQTNPSFKLDTASYYSSYNERDSLQFRIESVLRPFVKQVVGQYVDPYKGLTTAQCVNAFFNSDSHAHNMLFSKKKKRIRFMDLGSLRLGTIRERSPELYEYLLRSTPQQIYDDVMECNNG